MGASMKIGQKKYSERMRPPRPTINYKSQSANQMRTSPSNALKPTFSAKLVSKGWPRNGADQTVSQNLAKHIAIQAIVPIRQRLGAHLLLFLAFGCTARPASVAHWFLV